jgi:hypothetical protein
MTVSIAALDLQIRPSRLGKAGSSARRARRLRAKARLEDAQRARPTLDADRLTPILGVLRVYREHIGAPGRDVDASPLAAFVRTLLSEVEALESWAASRGKRIHHDGSTIRKALHFLRTFSRIMSLDFSNIPIEERDLLVALLALEHRWCYAAAGTTRNAFKIAIGRTGAR